jgi:hypothetical protein
MLSTSLSTNVNQEAVGSFDGIRLQPLEYGLMNTS